MPISQYDADRLSEAGFTAYEIEELSRAETGKGEPQPPIDTDKPVWQSVMNSRRDWVEDKLSRGWSWMEIRMEIENYYRKDVKRSPWDFIRAEYRPPKRMDYVEMIRRRSQAEIQEELDNYF